MPWACLLPWVLYPHSPLGESVCHVCPHLPHPSGPGSCQKSCWKVGRLHSRCLALHTVFLNSAAHVASLCLSAVWLLSPEEQTSTSIFSRAQAGSKVHCLTRISKPALVGAARRPPSTPPRLQERAMCRVRLVSPNTPSRRCWQWKSLCPLAQNQDGPSPWGHEKPELAPCGHCCASGRCSCGLITDTTGCCLPFSELWL